MITHDFMGQVAVISGGAGCIGAAVAEGFQRAGGKVALWDLSAASADTDNAISVTVDVGDANSVEAATARTMEQLGRIDCLVNSAGIAGPNAKLWEYPLADWNRIQRVNLDGVFHCCRSIVPHMIERKYGRIVNIASIAGKEGNPNASAYSASKAAVIGLTKSLGKESARNWPATTLPSMQ